MAESNGKTQEQFKKDVLTLLGLHDRSVKRVVLTIDALSVPVVVVEEYLDDPPGVLQTKTYELKEKEEVLQDSPTRIRLRQALQMIWARAAVDPNSGYLEMALKKTGVTKWEYDRLLTEWLSHESLSPDQAQVLDLVEAKLGISA